MSQVFDDFKAAVEAIGENQVKLHQFINGGADDLVETDSGPIPTLAGLAQATIERGAVVAAPAYADTTSGLAATAEGEYFNVPSPNENEEFILYLHAPGDVAEETKRTPSSKQVMQPNYVGKANGWVDPFFRHISINEDFNGRRWFSTTGGFSSLEFVDNPVFKGRSIRKNTSGTGNLCGPMINLNDIGAAEGDAVTVRCLIVGAGADVVFAGRFYSANMAPLGTQMVGNIVTAGAAPEVSTISEIVPAEARYIFLYPFTNTPDGYFDIVALWAGRGGAAAVPAWPSYNDLDYIGLVLKSQAQAEDDFYTAYGIDFTADYSAASPEITAPSFTLYPRPAPFSGWGSQYTTPMAISVNLIRIPGLTRSTPANESELWSTIRVEVRDIDRTGKVLAYSEVVIEEDASSVGGLEFPLLDPLSNEPITLTENDLSSTFMVGFIAYNRYGAPAIVGECQGEAGEYAGSAYYYHGAANDWRDYTANVAQAINLYNASDLVVTRKISNRDVGEAPGPTDESVDLVLGPFVYQAPGREINLYFDNLLWQRSSDYLFDVTCPVGRQFERRMRVNGTQTAGEHALTVTAHRPYDQEKVGEVNSTLRIADSAAGAGQNRKLLLVGDSLTAGGEVITEVVSLFGGDVMGLTAIGTRGTSPNLHEGRGGWKVSDYTTEGRNFFEFTVSGIVDKPAINAADYSHNGSVYRVQEAYLDVNGDGTLICERRSGGNVPSVSGTLTKDNEAAGDTTISFSAWETVAGNPFWDDVAGQLDFANYLSLNGFSMTAGDWVVINLGINDVFGQTTDAGVDAIASTAFTQLDALVTNIQQVNTGIRVGICIAMPPTASQDGFGIDYLNGQTKWRFKRNILRWGRSLVDHFDGREGANIYIIPTHCNYDTLYNSQHGNSAVNARNPETVMFHTNGVHPALAGYLQIADSVYSAIKYHG